MSAWIAWGLALSGFAFLAVAMERHTTAVLERDIKPLSRALSQGAGVALLASALAECWARWSPSIAIAAWLGTLSLAAVSAAFVLTYRPRLLPAVALVGFTAAMLAWQLPTS